MLPAGVKQQILIGFSLTMCSISDGLIFGQMSGMIDALSKEDNDVPLTEDDISWIASLVNITCIVGFAVVGVITEYLGRRKTVTLISLPVCLTWVIVYFARDKVTLIITRIIFGTSFGGIIILIAACIGEYFEPNSRSVIVNLISNVGTNVGIILGHVLSIILHWRRVALIAIIPSALSIILPLFWIESPAWLATKGRFEECQGAFRKLHATSEVSENELQLLICYEKQKQNERLGADVNDFIGKKVIDAMKTVYFWKIVILSTILCIYKVASGRILFSTLAITMLQDISGSPDILFFTIAVDGFITISSLVSCYFLKRFKIRFLIFTVGTTSNICLIVFILCLYLFPGNIYYLSWIKMFLLGLYFVTQTVGPNAALETLMSEIFPVDLRFEIIFIIGIVSCVVQFLNIKYATTVIYSIGYHGIFFVHLCTMLICQVHLWFFLPETKGRSLQEIEYYFKNNTFEYKKELPNMEEGTKFIVNSS